MTSSWRRAASSAAATRAPSASPFTLTCLALISIPACSLRISAAIPNDLAVAAVGWVLQLLLIRGLAAPGEPPRRPDPERPGAPIVHRSESWKYAFVASRCQVCGFRHLPPTRVCLECHAIDQMQPERLADVRGTVATFTIDHLAFSLSPPVVGVIVDFDGGGRYRCEMTDVSVPDLAIGSRVEMTFRRIYTAQGVHNYFWKARPLQVAPPANEEE